MKRIIIILINLLLILELATNFIFMTGEVDFLSDAFIIQLTKWVLISIPYLVFNVSLIVMIKLKYSHEVIPFKMINWTILSFVWVLLIEIFKMNSVLHL